jgi:E1A/CREB-binding protein
MQGQMHGQVQHQMQQQQRSMSGGRSWHIKNNIRQVVSRQNTFRQIVELLKAERIHSFTHQEWFRKIPEMANKHEESLYQSANSFDEYKDEATLERRLQTLILQTAPPPTPAPDPSPISAPTPAPAPALQV